MAMMTGQHILVLGLGESGLAAARLARLYGAEVTVLDRAATGKVAERASQLQGKGIAVHLDWTRETFPGPVDLAVISPGVSPASGLGRLAAALGAPVISELELGYRYCACPILALTGTNGKTTTVELLTHCLRRAGYRAAAAGNIGLPLCEVARRSHALDVLVVEVSSFQLEGVDRFAPLAAAILNVTPDHLDRHGSMDRYLEAKLRLLRNLAGAERAVLRADLARLDAARAALPAGVPLTFAAEDDGRSAYVGTADGQLCRRRQDGVEPLVATAALPFHGRHNHENILAALALAEAGGFDPRLLAPHVRSFSVGQHRLETVAVAGGIRFVNDSKATNPDAMLRALEVVAGNDGRPNVLLIAGGVDKGVDFAGLEERLGRHVKGVFLIGSCRERLAKLWNNVVSCREYVSLDAAVDAATEEAAPGDVVLLSPGCASQDMFGDYAERGRRFRDLVKRRVGA